VKTVRVEPEAKQELAAAAAWYERRREGLGLELVAEVDAVFAAITWQPEPVSAISARGTRAWSSSRCRSALPLSIAFVELPNVVRVLAVAHEKRRPGYWRGRLGDT
jgi:toxin ParE1/3/4